MKNVYFALLLGFSCTAIAQEKLKTSFTEKTSNQQIKIETSSEDKVFIKEYTYNSSEDDSKNSSRKKAITQIKMILTEEIGTHIESYLEIKKESIHGTSYKSVQKEIKSLSAGITKIKILDEKWNGKTYYIKASVKVNEQKTMALLLEAIKARSSKEDVERLNKILAEQEKTLTQQNTKVSKMNKKLISQEILNEVRKNKLIEMKKKLTKYNAEEIQQKEENAKILTELERKKALLKKLNNKAEDKVTNMIEKWENTRNLLCSVGLGMKYSDIGEVIFNQKSSWTKYFTPTNTSSGYNYYELRGSGTHTLKLRGKFTHSVCPSSFLGTKYGYHCVYMNFNNGLLSSRIGCKGYGRTWERTLE